MRDFTASIVVFLVAMPLCMGIAIASGVPAERGLITGIIGGIVVGSLAGSPLQVSSPAAGLAVIVFEIVQKHGLSALGPLLVLAGVIQLIAGALRLGQWFRAISPAVVHGMLAGIGLLIVAGQLHVLIDRSPLHSGVANLMAIPAAFGSLSPANLGQTESAFLVGLDDHPGHPGLGEVPAQALKLVPGALVGVIAGTLIAAGLGLQIKRIETPESILGALSFPAVADFGMLAQPAMLLDRLRHGLHRQRRDAALGGGGGSDAQRGPHQVQQGADGAGRGQHPVRPGRRPADDRRHRAQLRQRPGRRGHPGLGHAARRLDPRPSSRSCPSCWSRSRWPPWPASWWSPAGGWSA